MSEQPTFPYAVTTDETTVHVLAPDAPDYHRVQLPDGQVTSIPGDSAAVLTPEALADWLANPPPYVPGVPQELTRPRFMMGLRKALGLTEGAVFAMISGIEDAELQEDVRDWYEHGVFFRRDDALLNSVADAQGITAEQLDEVFRVGGGA
jgi:hypothetical protein